MHGSKGIASTFWGAILISTVIRFQMTGWRFAYFVKFSVMSTSIAVLAV